MAPTDRDVLLVLYRSTDGPRWMKRTNWDTDMVLSEWYGVEVNNQGRVVKLALGNNNLRGSVLTHRVGDGFREIAIFREPQCCLPTLERRRVLDAVFAGVILATQYQCTLDVLTHLCFSFGHACPCNTRHAPRIFVFSSLQVLIGLSLFANSA